MTRRLPGRLTVLGVCLAAVAPWKMCDSWCRGTRPPPETQEEFHGYPAARQLELLGVWPGSQEELALLMRQFARGGDVAYETLLPHLRGTAGAVPFEIAADATAWVHVLGKDLRGTEAEQLLREVVEQSSGSRALAAERALRRIRAMKPGLMRPLYDERDAAFLDQNRGSGPAR
jgi:hypothetical protein